MFFVIRAGSHIYFFGKIGFFINESLALNSRYLFLILYQRILIFVIVPTIRR
ncbi:hypothetical protein LEP1GSC073_3580 [Leptospira noguchii str. Cascata]|nr:hypothetical protein LEP1GSC072_3886 [Leptospira noguchii str. Bonito]EMS86736.1 hypothetical protein LEP1GSC073_3580 [Leptospira noguchii str. Cascata]